LFNEDSRVERENSGIARGSRPSGWAAYRGGERACRAGKTKGLCYQGKNLGGNGRLEACPSPPSGLMTTEDNPLLRVCRLLNGSGAKYLIVGAWAMILNSVIRATEDVDILIADDLENCQRVIDALSGLADGAARELVAQDFLENVVIKISDEVEVDVSTRAWTVTYTDAAPNALSTEVDGVLIHYLSLPDLIRSKQTYRDQDRVDVERLRRLLP